MCSDDIVHLSSTEQGRQNCVNNLFELTDNCKMAIIINTKKTKFLVSNKSGRHTNIHILWKTDLIICTCVQNYTY